MNSKYFAPVFLAFAAASPLAHAQLTLLSNISAN
jgi:hypothetical protein